MKSEERNYAKLCVMKNKYKNAPVQAKAAFWFAVCSVLQRGIATITTPIFTRLLSTEEYGKVSVFFSWQALLGTVTILTLPWGVFEQGLIKFSEERKLFTSSLLGLMTTLLGVWLIVYLSFQGEWNALFSLDTAQVFLLFSNIWSSAVFSFWSLNQRVEYRYIRLVKLTLLMSIANPLLSILLVLSLKDGATARILGAAAVSLCFSIGLFFFMMREGKCFFSSKNWKYAFSFNLPLLPHYLAQGLLSSSDRIMIEKLISEGAAGIYSLAYSLSLVLGFIGGSIKSGIGPWVFGKIKSRKAGDISKVIYPVLILVAGVNLVLIIFAPEIIRIFAPKGYYEAIWVVPPVTMAGFYSFLYGWFADFEFYYEKTKFMSAATMLGALVNVGLNLICIRRFGYIAAGYTTLFCYLLYAVLHFRAMKGICKKEYPKERIYDGRIIALISAVFMLAGFLFAALYEAPLLRYGLILLLAGILWIRKRALIGAVREIRDKIERER